MEHKTMMTSDINTHEKKTGPSWSSIDPNTKQNPLVDPPQRDETVNLILLFYNLKLITKGAHPNYFEKN